MGEDCRRAVGTAIGRKTDAGGFIVDQKSECSGVEQKTRVQHVQLRAGSRSLCASSLESSDALLVSFFSGSFQRRFSVPDKKLEVNFEATPISHTNARATHVHVRIQLKQHADA